MDSGSGIVCCMVRGSACVSRLANKDNWCNLHRKCARVVRSAM